MIWSRLDRFGAAPVQDAAEGTGLSINHIGRDAGGGVLVPDVGAFQRQDAQLAALF